MAELLDQAFAEANLDDAQQARNHRYRIGAYRMDSMKRLLTGLDQATRRELKKNLEQRKDELNRKGITSSSSLAKSPILQAVVDAAAKNAMEERDAILSSIDDIIDEKYDNKIEAFIRTDPTLYLQWRYSN